MHYDKVQGGFLGSQHMLLTPAAVKKISSETKMKKNKFWFTRLGFIEAVHEQ